MPTRFAFASACCVCSAMLALGGCDNSYTTRYVANPGMVPAIAPRPEDAPPPKIIRVADAEFASQRMKHQGYQLLGVSQFSLIDQSESLSDPLPQAKAVGADLILLQVSNEGSVETWADQVAETSDGRYPKLSSNTIPTNHQRYLVVAAYMRHISKTVPVAGPGEVPAKALTFQIMPQPKAAQFEPGDSITVSRVTGSRERIEAGGTYTIEGEYTLGSVGSAILGLSVPYRGGQLPWTNMLVLRGSGNFALTLNVPPIETFHSLHIAFYPTDGSQRQQGGVYIANAAKEP